MAQWDRRGARKTLGRNGRSGSGEITLDRMVEGGIEVTEYLGIASEPEGLPAAYHKKVLYIY